MNVDRNLQRLVILKRLQKSAADYNANMTPAMAGGTPKPMPEVKKNVTPGPVPASNVSTPTPMQGVAPLAGGGDTRTEAQRGRTNINFRAAAQGNLRNPNSPSVDQGILFKPDETSGQYSNGDIANIRSQYGTMSVGQMTPEQKANPNLSAGIYEKDPLTGKPVQIGVSGHQQRNFAAARTPGRWYHQNNTYVGQNAVAAAQAQRQTIADRRFTPSGTPPSSSRQTAIATDQAANKAQMVALQQEKARQEQLLANIRNKGKSKVSATLPVNSINQTLGIPPSNRNDLLSAR